MPPSRKVLRVRITAKDRAALDAVPFDKLDMGCAGGVQEQPDGSLAIDALVDEPTVKAMSTKRGVNVDVVADMTEVGKQRQKEVGKGNRFAEGDPVPRGFGKKIRGEESR